MEKNTFQISIIRPAGNDQLLVKGLVAKEYRRAINDAMIKKFPTVEQVSFYEFDEKNNLAKLELAGGEFCGNATRSLAYLLLKGSPGKLSLQVSGTGQLLTAGVKKSNTAFAQMPIFKDFDRIKRIGENLFRVDLEGITHLVSYENVFALNNDELKAYAKNILEKENLLFSVPAAGVMFVEKKNKQIIMRPIVWVRDIETLLYETACASGTTAVGLCESLKQKKNRFKISVVQPTKQTMSIEIIKNKNEFQSATIDGPIKILDERIVIC